MHVQRWSAAGWTEPRAEPTSEGGFTADTAFFADTLLFDTFYSRTVHVRIIPVLSGSGCGGCTPGAVGNEGEG